MRPDDTIATMLPTRLGSFWPMVSMVTPASGLSAFALRIQPSIAQMKPMIAAAVQTLPLALVDRMAIAHGTTAEPMMLPMAMYTQPRPRPSWLSSTEREPMKMAKRQAKKRDMRTRITPSVVLPRSTTAVALTSNSLLPPLSRSAPDLASAPALAHPESVSAANSPFAASVPTSVVGSALGSRPAAVMALSQLVLPSVTPSLSS